MCAYHRLTISYTDLGKVTGMPHFASPCFLALGLLAVVSSCARIRLRTSRSGVRISPGAPEFTGSL